MSLAYKAMMFARTVHAGQVRKYTGAPYTDHLAEVAGIPAEFGFMIAIFYNGLVYHRLAFPDSVSFKEQSDLFLKVLMTYLEAAGIK